MKQILLLNFLFCSIGLMSQASFTITKTVVDTTFDEMTFEPVGKSKVCYEGADSVFLYWRIEDVMVPFGWDGMSYLCDKNFCYGPDTRECPLEDPVVLQSGECGIMDFHLFFGVSVSYGKYKVHVWEKGKENIVETITYNFNKPTSTNEIDVANIKIYPNPVTEYFQLKNAKGVSSITITDLLGKKVEHFDVNGTGGSYSVSKLGSGIYFANLKDRSNRLIKSVRLQKK